MEKVIQKAGVEEWDGSWQILRRSGEMEWAQTFPQFPVSRWIGHSITVSGKHYVNHIPDELFQRVAGLEKETAQKPSQIITETDENG